ncbi:MAG: response regulator [Firmicutes bacterium]|nr:response regulator [Bacillota bacterium]
MVRLRAVPKIEDPRILIVEDSQAQAFWLQSVLKDNGYCVSVAYNGKQALAEISKKKPTIIISDIMMPEMDGYELCRHIKTDPGLKNIPVILLTLLDDPRDILKGLGCGADYFITKPCEERYILARIQYILENWNPRQLEDKDGGAEVFYGHQRYRINLARQQIIDNLLFAYEIAIQRNRDLIKAQEELKAINNNLEERIKEKMSAFMAEHAERKRIDEELKHSLEKLQRTFQETVQALASTSEKRDPYTAGHQQRVAELASSIAKVMGLPDDQIEGVRVAGLLHDIGKVSVPAEILSKPSKLAELEYSIIKNHPRHGFEVLKPIEFPWPIAYIVLQHHERLDGSGYPSGLSGDDILLEARILAVADVIDAMISHRPYRPACSLEAALQEISNNRGKLYDAQVVDACLKLFGGREHECA